MKSVMDGGARFVETLKRTGYLKANSLNGEDFDWLFETLESKSFLEWFCTALNEHNVLSEEELQSFNTLLKSSKPILEEEALNEVLKISKPLDLNTNNCEEEEENLKMLENEFEALKKIKQVHGKENFEAKISSLNNDIAKIKIDLSQINSGTLPSLIKENAELLNMPVVKGDFDLQIARQDYYISRQDQICNQLIKQKASFEFLQLAYEIEFQKHRENSRLLENMVKDLKLNNDILLRTLETMSEPSIALQRTPRNTVEPKDIAAHRMCQLLEGRNPKQLFRTYERLEEMAEKLHLDSVSVLDQLVHTDQEQNLLLSKMDADLTILRDSIYFKGESVCLSNQQLSEQFQQLEFQLNKMNPLITDILADIKAKRDVLETNKLQEMERKLYVFFFNDEEHLKNIVETLEKRVEAQPNL